MGQLSHRASKVNNGWCWETHKEGAATQPLLSLPGLRAVMGGGQRPALWVPAVCPCPTPQNVLFLKKTQLNYLVPAGDAGCHLAGTWKHIPTVPVLAWGCLWIKQHFLSPKGSHRNSAALPRQSCRQTGSLCNAGHTLAKLPQSVLTLWRETLHPQASRGTAGVCGCARRGGTQGPPLGAQTLHCAASTPSLLKPPTRKSDAQSRGRHFWCALGPLEERAEPVCHVILFSLLPVFLHSHLYYALSLNGHGRSLKLRHRNEDLLLLL